MKKFLLSLRQFIVITSISFIVTGMGYLFLYKPNNEVIIDPEYAFDISDKELLVDYADEVVVGTVKKELSGESDDAGVYTPYTITIDDVIKGDLVIGKDVDIAQRIGYDNLLKAHVKLEEEDSYLLEGQTYIFALSFDKYEDIYRIVAPVYGNIEIKNLNLLKDEKVSDTAIVKEYKNIAKEIQQKNLE